MLLLLMLMVDIDTVQVADDWTVKISDFGLSLHLTKDLVCRGFKGNVKYSPPEILRYSSLFVHCHF
jgi:serine/threonine protein kinase